MEQLKNIKQCLVSSVQTQLGDLKKTDAKELGEVIDMIKDLEEAMYYCAITEAMEDKKDESKHQNNINYYMEPVRYYDGQSSSGGGNSRNYTPYMEYAPYMMRDEDWRNKHMYNGRSGDSRRMYMESKSFSGKGQPNMKELETYITDLSDDIVEMVRESTPEEKQVLSTKLQTLATKVNK